MCNLLLKSLFAKKQDAGGPTHKKTELEAIDNLTVLLEENEPEDLIDSLDFEAILAEVDGMISAPPPPKSNMVALKKKSSLYPAHSSKPNTAAFFKLVSKDIQNLKYPPQGQGKLTNGEHRALQSLTQNQLITIKPADRQKHCDIKQHRLCSDVQQHSG